MVVEYVIIALMRVVAPLSDAESTNVEATVSIYGVDLSCIYSVSGLVTVFRSLRAYTNRVNKVRADDDINATAAKACNLATTFPR